MPSIRVLPLLALAACTPPEDTDDTDTTALPATFDGTLTYLSTRDAATRCDLEVDVHGTLNPDRLCPDCGWVYDVVGTVVRDGSDDECRASPVVTLVEGYGYTDLAVAFAPTFEVTWVEPSVTITDVLLSGYNRDGGDYYLADVWEPLAWSENTASLWSHDDAGFAWNRTGAFTETEIRSVGWDECPDFTWSPGGSAASGPTVTEDLPCDNPAQDVWTFTGTASETVEISVDTVAANTAFAPFFWVNGPSECTIVNAIDTFACAFAPSTGGRSCPAVSLVLPETGTYEIRVGTDFSCTGTIGDYALARTGIGDVTLAVDDGPALEEVTHPWTESASFTAAFGDAP